MRIRGVIWVETRERKLAKVTEEVRSLKTSPVSDEVIQAVLKARKTG